MNPIQLIVNATLTLLLPIMIGAVYWYSRALAQRLPEHQRLALIQFARMAAQYVLREHSEALDKQGLAVAYCGDLFAMFKLRLPPPQAIEIAVGSAFFEASRPAQIPE